MDERPNSKGVEMNHPGRYVYNGVVYSKKNSKSIIVNRRTGKPMLVSSKRAKQMERSMADEFSLQIPPNSGTDKAVEVQMWLYRKDNIARDLDNTATSVLDGLVGGGVLKDDNFSCVKILGIQDCGVDKTLPRVEIEIKVC